MLSRVGGGCSSYPYHLTSLDGTLFFTASPGEFSELWKSDGIAAGTERVKDFRELGDYGVSPLDYSVIGRTLFFVVLAPDGVELLWTSDGTAAGTVRATSLTPVSHIPRQRDNVYQTTVAGGKLFFAAANSRHGLELWKALP